MCGSAVHCSILNRGCILIGLKIVQDIMKTHKDQGVKCYAADITFHGMEGDDHKIRIDLHVQAIRIA